MRARLKGALPIPVVPARLPEVRLYLPNGNPFLKAPYVDLGYTHFDVWCVGAVGGQGGNASASYFLVGGGGGGGGLHRVAGPLTDLPASCPVSVGVAGGVGSDASNVSLFNPSDPYQPNPDYVPAGPGQDGGASSFNDALCRASGGKGGHGAITYGRASPDHGGSPTPLDPGPFRAGDGGEGGRGGRIEPGGGALGGYFTVRQRPVGESPAGEVYVSGSFNAADGIWDDVVGAGGGGGRGGEYRSDNAGGIHSEEFLAASSGGRGSYSFGDTTVFGPRGIRSKRVLVSYVNQDDVPILPGSGGGANIKNLSIHGSNAPKSSPDGVVFIRLMQRI